MVTASPARRAVWWSDAPPPPPPTPLLSDDNQTDLAEAEHLPAAAVLTAARLHHTPNAGSPGYFSPLLTSYLTQMCVCDSNVCVCVCVAASILSNQCRCSEA